MDNDFISSSQKRPSTWRETVLALRGEMVTHPVIVAACHLFSIEINILDWQGVINQTYFVFSPNNN